MQRYLQTDPVYCDELKHVWLWDEFPYKTQLGGVDLGIDLVAEHIDGSYWAVQCKCYAENSVIDKPKVDSFIATANRSFTDDDANLHHFSYLLWISTTNRWGDHALETLKGQRIKIGIVYQDILEQSPVDWEKLEDGIHGSLAQTSKKSLREHQKQALESTHKYFKDHDRGKLIMACGTGKTYTALKIAEHETNQKGTILFLVPSIALLGQTLREWKADAAEHIHAICICSDPEVSKKKTKQTDDAEYFHVEDLAYPASTKVEDIHRQFDMIRKLGSDGMTVVFSTYQSIEVVSKAQKELLEAGFPEFDMIICDEAHRTTGVKLSDSIDDSAFVKVHDNNFIKAKKRLYMTATPRLFSDDTKSKAAQANVTLCSMDDATVYGEEIYRIGFGEAVEKGLLTDYKVLILTINEANIPPALRSLIASKDTEIDTDMATKLIGCINALSKQVLGDDGDISQTDPDQMRRAVAFCSSIKESKLISRVFNEVSDKYISSLPEEIRGDMVTMHCEHIDGSMTTPEKDRLLGWLKSEPKANECHVLTNVRVLSEGVDVPSLDSIIFLSSRSSHIDVVQSVGRVMRKAPNKKYGYIIIPVLVPSDVEPEVALDNNDRFKVIWNVLNALRAHDDRFNAMINKIDLNENKPKGITPLIPTSTTDEDGNTILIGSLDDTSVTKQYQISFGDFAQLQSVIYAKMVQKVGDRRYWEQWAKNVAEIAERQVERITRLIADKDKHQQAFQGFIEGLRKNINPSISEQEAIDMLSQHIITKPVFDALFEGYSFVSENAISKSMQNMLDLLEEQAIEKDTQTLEKFYESVKMRAQGIDNAEGKQKIIIELYDKFFKTAFPKMVEQLGIVYTPTECVDFIIHSVNDVLQKEFGRSISDEGIHVLDPFTGTGTFMTRLIQSGLIKPEDLKRKYQHELHANEIVLLAYYIATINIENAFHDMTPEDDGIGTDTYIPFEGIVLTDTFQLGETEDGNKIFSEMFPQNSERVKKQVQAPLRVILGNPPYSIGQKSANDNAQNQSYLQLDSRIEQTYVKQSSAALNKALYDSYIKAFRWSTDRLDESGGIIAFISNAAWLDGNSTDGFRKAIEKEFTSIYVFNLRGNQRTSGELSRKEGGKIFGSGSRTPISITLLVKNPNVKSESATIHYHDIGDYLSREQKLDIIKNYGSVGNADMPWTVLKPNEHGDWICIRNESFATFIPIEPEKKFDVKSKTMFNTYAIGVATNRDAWVYNNSYNCLILNMSKTIKFFNEQSEGFKQAKSLNSNSKIDEYLNPDHNQISWTVNLKKDAENGVIHSLKPSEIVTGIYRPYFKQHLYFDKPFIERPGLWHKLYPTKAYKNFVISITGIGGSKEFSTLMTDLIPNLHLVENGQYFPLYYYEENASDQEDMFGEDFGPQFTRKDAISDFIHEKALQQYGLSKTGSGTITKEDIFYYVYGFLHSPEYRDTFANDLKKMLPRIPLVDSINDFWVFSKVGRALADLHINYESIAPYPDCIVTGAESSFFTVEKMRFPKKDQKDTINYNSKITISNIPEKAYEYVVNGKSAIEWIMERYQITTHKDSGITNNPNDWSEEVGNPRYILDLLLSIINVSVQTVDIVNGLPKVKFGE
ncbi:MAG: DEAD/DEAH box helicase [Candidatus Kapaibacteriota bacterium]